MAAASAASIHASLTAAIMVFELSGDYLIVLPLILSTVVATTASTLCGWVADVATALTPVGEQLRREVLAADYLQTDDTSVTRARRSDRQLQRPARDLSRSARPTGRLRCDAHARARRPRPIPGRLPREALVLV